MINYIKRQDLDVIKYDACINNSLQSRIYGFSWYLDIVADNWDVLVLDDYLAVMPIPWRKKMGVKYVYPPFWLLELGVFSIHSSIKHSIFFDALFQKFKFVESKLNTYSSLQNSFSFLIDKQMQVLSLDKEYANIIIAYRKDRRKDLQKAKKADVTQKWNDNPEKLIQLFKENVGKRTPFIVDKDYQVLHKLIHVCIEKRVGEVLSIYNKDNSLVASGFFLKHKDSITILISSTDFENRKNGENTFLIDSAIFKYQKNYKAFNFGGSSMKSIAKYFLSFGAETKAYQQIKYNNLPFWMRLFKK
jgi:hypothetical protein